MLLLQPLVGLLLISLAHGDCPIFFSPDYVVVEYGKSFSVNCSSTGKTDQFGLSWEGFDDTIENNDDIIISVNVTDWERTLTCYMYSYKTNCSLDLPVTIYKTPDSVSISIVNHTGPMIEGRQYELQCDVHDVAPVTELTVKWYKGQTLLNQTTFTEDSRTPVNVTTTLLIRPDRADDGAQYWCEAELYLGAEEPQYSTKSLEALSAELHRSFSVENQCPIKLIPRIAFVRYNGSVAVNCSTQVSHKGMGWEASEGAVPKTRDSLITWRVSHLTEWDIQPFCYINYEGQCQVELPVIIYKTPDSVSISIVNHRGPMIEGQQYELQCDVHDVAPVQNLTVKWYKGQTLLDQTNFTEDSRTPVNVNTTLLIRPVRADDGAQYWCEAELDLGAEGPQPPPKETSDALYFTVYYAPNIQSCNSWSPLTGTSLDSYPLNVNSVLGNPPPNISWSHKASSVNSSLPLTKFNSGQYEIIASNVLSNFSCSINITVEYPPELNCSESYEVKEKTLFQFPCIADGSPKPKLSLRKNGNIIHHELFFPNWNDSGQYQVIAENQRGTIHSTVTINILHDSLSYFAIVALVLGLLFFILILVVILLRLRRNKRGHYDVQSVKQYEMQPLSNGGPA
ncbi:hemicentin-1-like [Carassius carassius]|uniref:hemicentin-1-like n=1 Tax=Carassius carassius TaxID=217509 RepID=UPI0028693BF6|nr:hemicentin-1-like [Carassius carassius]